MSDYQSRNQIRFRALLAVAAGHKVFRQLKGSRQRGNEKISIPSPVGFITQLGRVSKGNKRARP
jgi:hypothetical protein